MSIEIKICGVKTPEALDAALAAGADMIGVNFFAPSPRHVDLATAVALGARAQGRAQIVALTVDADDTALAAIVEALAPDALQLHGNETPERVAAVKARFGRPVWKAIGIAGPEDVSRLPAYEAVADRLLLDAKAPKGASLPGGNGVPFDWNLLAGLDLARLDRRPPFMLSGGLTPDNVAQALALTHARAVDVSSGVESAPGVKDPARIAAFIRAARDFRRAGGPLAGRTDEPANPTSLMP